MIVKMNEGRIDASTTKEVVRAILLINEAKSLLGDAGFLEVLRVFTTLEPHEDPGKQRELLEQVDRLEAELNEVQRDMGEVSGEVAPGPNYEPDAELDPQAQQSPLPPASRPFLGVRVPRISDAEEEKWITVERAAGKMGVSVSTIRKWAKDESNDLRLVMRSVTPTQKGARSKRQMVCQETLDDMLINAWRNGPRQRRQECTQ